MVAFLLDGFFSFALGASVSVSCSLTCNSLFQFCVYVILSFNFAILSFQSILFLIFSICVDWVALRKYISSRKE
jgi:hypothetical protein